MSIITSPSTTARRTAVTLAVLAAAATASGAVTASAAPDVAGQATPAACGGSALAVSIGSGQAGLSHAGFVVRFRNISDRSCTITGYPGLDAVNAHGSVIRHAKRTLSGYLGGAAAVKTITVGPSSYASAFVEWVALNNHGGECRTAHSIAITAANTRRTVHRSEHVAICDLQVHPTVSGRSGDSRS